jgi:hypothetical protein
MKKAVLFLSFGILLSLAGCDSNMLEALSDDSSSEAKFEEARMALDDGNYQEAIDILAANYDATNPDPETVRILASAYMGLAGIDLTYILENSEESGDSFDTIASALSLTVTGQDTEARFITAGSADELLANLAQAQDYLNDLMDYYDDQGLTPDQDDTVQTGMASAIHFIIQLGQAASETTGSNIPLNKAAYREIFPDDENLDARLDDLADSLDEESLQDDLMDVSAAVDTLVEVQGADDDLAEEFDEFLNELLGGGDIGTFTGQSAAAYVDSELLGYI